MTRLRPDVRSRSTEDMVIFDIVMPMIPIAGIAGFITGLIDYSGESRVWRYSGRLRIIVSVVSHFIYAVLIALS